MGEYIFKRKEGNAEWRDNTNGIEVMQDAAIKITSEIKKEMDQGNAVFVIIFTLPNSEVISLNKHLEECFENSKISNQTEFVMEPKTGNCTDVISETTLQALVIPFVKDCIVENKLETRREDIKNALKNNLKDNLIYILPSPFKFPKENDDDQSFIENFILFWAGILERKLIMYQFINIEEAKKQYASLGKFLRELLDERDDLAKETFNNAGIIDGIIETRDIQLTEEYGLEDKIIDINSAIGKDNVENAKMGDKVK